MKLADLAIKACDNTDINPEWWRVWLDTKQYKGPSFVRILYENSCWSMFTMYWPQLSMYALVGRE